MKLVLHGMDQVLDRCNSPLRILLVYLDFKLNPNIRTLQLALLLLCAVTD